MAPVPANPFPAPYPRAIRAEPRPTSAEAQQPHPNPLAQHSIRLRHAPSQTAHSASAADHPHPRPRPHHRRCRCRRNPPAPTPASSQDPHPTPSLPAITTATGRPLGMIAAPHDRPALAVAAGIPPQILQPKPQRRPIRAHIRRCMSSAQLSVRPPPPCSTKHPRGGSDAQAGTATPKPSAPSKTIHLVIP